MTGADLDPRTTRRWLWGLTALGAVLRLVWGVVQDGMHYPDEVFQYLEPAFGQLHGHAHLAWEFERGARNWLLPWHYGALMAALEWVGLQGHALLHALWVHNAVLAALAVPLTYRLGVAAFAGDRRVGLLAAAAVALHPTLGLLAPHTLGEWHGLLFGTWAYALWFEHQRAPEAPGRWGRLLTMGALLGGVFIARFGLVVVVPLVFADFLLRWRIRDGVVAGVGFLGAMAVLGLADHLAWGSPFHSIVEYVEFNWVENGAERLEVKAATYYWDTAFLGRLGPAKWLLVVPSLLTLRSQWRLVAAWVVPLVLLSKVGIKQERFVSTLWPLVLASAAGGWVALGGWVARHPSVAATRWRSPLPVAVGLLAVAVTTAATLVGLQGERMRHRAGQFQAQHWLGEQGDVTGVLVGGSGHMNGGHLLLHRNVPQRAYRSASFGERVYSHVIAQTPELKAKLARSELFERVATFEQGVEVFRRDDRLVRPEAAPLPTLRSRTTPGLGGEAHRPSCGDGLALRGLDIALGKRKRVRSLRLVCGPVDAAAPALPKPEADDAKGAKADVKPPGADAARSEDADVASRAATERPLPSSLSVRAASRFVPTALASPRAEAAPREGRGPEGDGSVPEGPAVGVTSPSAAELLRARRPLAVGAAAGATAAAAAAAPATPTPTAAPTAATTAPPTPAWSIGPWFGAPGDSRVRRLSCPAGRVVVGLRGRAGARVDALGITCGLATDPAADTTFRKPIGGLGGDAFDYRCDPAYRLATLELRSGAAIDAVGVRCLLRD